MLKLPPVQARLWVGTRHGSCLQKAQGQAYFMGKIRCVDMQTEAQHDGTGTVPEKSVAVIFYMACNDTRLDTWLDAEQMLKN
jgi:ligand-binding sensor domain-containing protein